jgi:hypothetical protein
MSAEVCRCGHPKEFHRSHLKEVPCDFDGKCVARCQKFEPAESYVPIGPDRHPKWVKVEPGTVIPAGQPYRVEYSDQRPEWLPPGTKSVDVDGNAVSVFRPVEHGLFVETSRWFVDSSWRPPLELPTTPSIIRAVIENANRKVLLFGPSLEGTWGTIGDYHYDPARITAFEVLWTEGERGKDALVPWAEIDKLREEYPPNPGADMSPIDYFLRNVVRDR